MSSIVLTKKLRASNSSSCKDKRTGISFNCLKCIVKKAESILKCFSLLTKRLTSTQPSKLKFLLGRHLATNSFGLGRLFYKSSRQLQNFRCHGDQNGRNLEGWHMVHRSNRTASQDSQLFFVACFQHNEHFHLSNTKSLIVPVCTTHCP